jgi:hypothetical protein
VPWHIDRRLQSKHDRLSFERSRIDSKSMKEGVSIFTQLVDKWHQPEPSVYGAACPDGSAVGKPRVAPLDDCCM